MRTHRIIQYLLLFNEHFSADSTRAKHFFLRWSNRWTNKTKYAVRSRFIYFSHTQTHRMWIENDDLPTQIGVDVFAFEPIKYCWAFSYMTLTHTPALVASVGAASTALCHHRRRQLHATVAGKHTWSVVYRLKWMSEYLWVTFQASFRCVHAMQLTTAMVAPAVYQFECRWREKTANCMKTSFSLPTFSLSRFTRKKNVHYAYISIKRKAKNILYATIMLLSCKTKCN